MAATRSKAAPANAKQGGTVHAYLIAYNIVSFVAWNYVLYETLRVLYATSGDYSRVYQRVGQTLIYVQTTALLEILHTMIGLVRSPLMTTTMQVFSRIMVVWGICHMFRVPQVQLHPSFTTMTLAWCVTESIRYSYYALNLLGSQPHWLLWCRYTFFYFLYPLGAGSEAVLIYQSLSAAKAFSQLYYYYLVLLLFTYPPAFAQMYTHMISQRKKYLGTSMKAKKAR